MHRTVVTLLAFSWAALFAADAKPAATSNPGDDYRIGSRDTIQFEIYNQPDMKTVQRVTSSGEVRLPLIGTVSVAGTTLREAELLLEALYRSDGYFIEPQVILSVEKYAERFVSVLGQVKDPSRIELAAEDSRLGIIQAITQAGGFTRVARSDAVQVLRTTKGQEERLTVNMDELLNPKVATKTAEFQLLPGDIIFVPERAF